MARLIVPVAALLALGACATAPTPLPYAEPTASRFDSGVAPAAAPPRIEPQSSDPSQSPPNHQDAGGLAIGVGTTFDPGTFLVGAAVDLPAGNHIYWGPAVELGLSGSRTLIAAFLQGKYSLLGNDSGSRFEPYLQSGLGIAYEDIYNASGEASFLLNVGGGVRFDLSDRVRLGSQVLVNWIPGEIHDEHVYVSWEIAQLIVPF